MVRDQIAGRGISNAALLEAMSKVQREFFVPLFRPGARAVNVLSGPHITLGRPATRVDGAPVSAFAKLTTAAVVARLSTDARSGQVFHSA